MLKQEFLHQLGKDLSCLSRQERQEWLLFYSEMIDDRIEEGLTEEEAVAAVASRDLCADLPQKPKKRLRWWEITLLILGSPLWISLVAAAAAVAISLYAVVWSMVIVCWAVFAALVGTGFGAMVSGIAYLFSYPLSGFALIGAALVCTGLSVFAFWGCKWLTQVVVRLTARCFRRKEVVA